MLKLGGDKMSEKLVNKVLATLLVITLTFANVFLLGIYAQESYAASSTSNVQFYAYFREEDGQMYISKRAKQNEENYIYLSVSVREGYIKNSKISLYGAEEGQKPNFKLVEGEISSKNIKSIDFENYTIELNQINAGETYVIPIAIEMENAEVMPSAYFTGVANNAKIEGTYVNSQAKQEELNMNASNSYTLSWTTDLTSDGEDLNINQEIVTKIENEDSNKTIIQEKVTVSINEDKNPIKSTELNITPITFENNRLEKVEVIEILGATAGEKTAKVLEGAYDEENKTIQIVSSNEGETISWAKNSEDVYLITYIYEGKVENNIARIQYDATVVPYDARVTSLTARGYEDVILANVPNKSIIIETVSNTEELSKGYIYQNALSEEKLEATYQEIIKANVPYSENIETIEVTVEKDKFVKKDASELEETASYLKTTKVLKDSFIKMLGEDGEIKIYDIQNNLLGTINTQSKEENGYLVFEYTEEKNEVKLISSKPIINGIIEIINDKVINDEISLTREEIKELDYIKMKDSQKVKLTDTEMKAQINLDNNNYLSKDNDTLNMNVILNTDEITDELFKNPKIEIELPSIIKNVEVDTPELLYENGLRVAKTEVITNEAGNKVIKLELEGEQTKYDLGSIVGGTRISIRAKCSLPEMFVTEKSKIKMTYSNENENSKQAETDVTIKAEEGLILINRAENFNSKNEILYTTGSVEKTGNLERNSSEKTINVTEAVVNNYGDTLDNVSIIGKIPYEGNKDENGTDLNSTINMQLNSNVTITGTEEKVYYSESLTAKEDDSNWSETRTENAKAFKIVLSQMPESTIIQINYSLKVPANLEYSKEAHSTYTVKYQFNGQAMEEKSSIKFATEETPINETANIERHEKVTIETAVSLNGKGLKENDEVLEGQHLDYVVKVTNTTNEELSNVKVVATPQNGVIYGLYDVSIEKNGSNLLYGELPEQKEISKEAKLAPGESIELKYTVVANEIEENNNSIFSDVNVTINNEENIASKTATNKIKDAEIKATLKYSKPEEDPINSNGFLQVELNIENLTEEVLNNVQITMDLPEELTFTEGTDWDEEYQISFANGRMSFEIPELNVDENKTIYIALNTAKMNTNLTQKDISINFVAKVNNNQYESNVLTKTINQTETEMQIQTQSTLANNSEIKENTQVTYTTTIVNKGKLDGYVSFGISLPMYSKGTTVKVNNEKREVSEDTKYYYYEKSLRPEENVKIEVTTTLDYDTLVQFYDEISTKILVAGQEEKEYKYNILQRKEDNEQIDKSDMPDNMDEATDDEEPDYVIQPTPYPTAEQIPDDFNEEPDEPIETDNPTVTPTQSTEVTPTLEPTQSGEIMPTPSAEVTATTSVTPTPSAEVTATTSVTPTQSTEPTSTPTSTTVPTPTVTPTEVPVAKHSISGTIWLDENGDGSRDNEEQVLSGTTVMLINSNNQFVTDENGNTLTVLTDKTGAYKFTNIPEGKYIVLFRYDSKQYKLTQYQKSGIADTLNSDAIETKVTIDGNQETVGLTNTLELNKDLTSIDAGLVKTSKFDLKLDKYISKITVQTSKGTETFEYSNKQFVKVEIPSKQIQGANVIVEYKIVVTNEGDVEGTASKIVDYLPKDLKFNSDANKDWYKDTDGYIYSTALKNTIIKPGESKELSLVVTKTMTGENTGVTSNTAEIADSYNKQGIGELDSIAGNKVSGEDDLSLADLIITIKTGSAVLYIGLAITCIAIVATGVYMIKKKVIGKED